MANILGEYSQPLSDADNELLCLQAIRRAADNDPKWAAWWLQHHPATSSTWSDPAVEFRIEKQVTNRFINVVMAYSNAGYFTLEERLRFIQFMRAEGLNNGDYPDDGEVQG